MKEMEELKGCTFKPKLNHTMNEGSGGNQADLFDRN